MHFDTATRQRWMSVLAHSDPEELLARMQTLQLAPDYELIRAPETGLVQLRGADGRDWRSFLRRRRDVDPRRHSPDRRHPRLQLDTEPRPAARRTAAQPSTR